MTNQRNTRPMGVECAPGELLHRRKGLVMHTGVSLGEGRVLHNTPGRGEHVSSFEDFAQGRAVRVSPISPQARERIQDLDVNAFERPYNPFTNNCEHTASRATDGHASSPQLQKLAVEALVGAAVLIAFRRPLVALGVSVGSRLIRKLAKKRRR